LGEVIFEDNERNLMIRRSSTLNPAFLRFLERTVWGSAGVQYTMADMAGVLQRIKEPHFLSITENDELVAVSTLIQKTTRLAGQDYSAFYSYALAVDPPKRGHGYGALMAGQALRYGLSKMGEKGIFYGYVEADNTRSLKTVQTVGRISLGQYHILVISRFCPQDDVRLKMTEEAEREKVVQLLSEQYVDHALLDFEQSINTGDYFTLREGGEILAGIQIERRHLNLKHLPGLSGLILVKVLPQIPYLRRLFPHRNYHFLTFGNIYAKEGREAEIFGLMEALLARHQLHFGMVYMDKRSPVYQRLAVAGEFGIINSLLDVPVQVMVYFKGFSKSEIADIRRQPLFISMMDPV
jgi:GNAT superfamily N-acetyltransferase